MRPATAGAPADTGPRGLRCRRVLVIGAGRAGAGYAAAASAGGAHVVVIDPLISQVGVALRMVAPEVAVVAVPPRHAAALARQAAQAGAVVLVTHPAAVTPGALAAAAVPGGRAFVALEALFDPEVAALLGGRVPRISRAELTVRAHRPASAYQGWRARRDTGGGVLHQQALPGLVLVSRLLAPHPGPRAINAVLRPRDGVAVEAGITADCWLGDAAVRVDGQVDLPSGRLPRMQLLLQTAAGPIRIGGPSWDAGLAHPAHAEHQETLRRAVLAAATAVADGELPHPSLVPLAALAAPLRLVYSLYRAARIQA